MPIIEIKNLTKNFGGVKSIDDLSLNIAKGTITGIIGPNGTGKTTLINIISGTLGIDKGSIEIEGKEIRGIKPWEAYSRGITRTFQSIRLFEQMTVLDNILVVMTKRNVVEALFDGSRNTYLQKAESALNRVGLLEKKNQLAANLSYGQRRLLEIARVIAADTDIILLDEPFSGVYPGMLKTVAQILKELKERGKTIIFIEHNIELVRELCDYLFVMSNGKLLAAGKTLSEA